MKMCRGLRVPTSSFSPRCWNCPLLFGPCWCHGQGAREQKWPRLVPLPTGALSSCVLELGLFLEKSSSPYIIFQKQSTSLSNGIKKTKVAPCCCGVIQTLWPISSPSNPSESFCQVEVNAESHCCPITRVRPTPDGNRADTRLCRSLLASASLHSSLLLGSGSACSRCP